MVLIKSENRRMFVIHDQNFSILKNTWTFNLIEIGVNGRTNHFYEKIELQQETFDLMLEELRKGELHVNFRTMLNRLQVEV